MAVSIVLVAGALVGTAASVSVSSNLERATEETRVATRAAALVMERVRSSDFDTLMTDFDGRSLDVGSMLGSSAAGRDATANVSMREFDNGSSRWTVYEVTVDVSWESTNGERQMQLVSFVCDRSDASASLSGTGSTEADEGLEGDSLAAAAAAALDTDVTSSAEGTEPVADTGTETGTDTGTDPVDDTTVIVEETASRGKSGDAPGQNK